MKLSRLDMAIRHRDLRASLQRQLDVLNTADNKPVGVVNNGRPLVILIDGEAQDDAMSFAARAAVEAEIRGRIAAIDKDLEALGIEVD